MKQPCDATDEPTYAGEFETHVTVEAPDHAELERFQRVCSDLEVQCVNIELARGVVRSQPMTSSHHHGTLQETRRRAATLAAELERRGFSVSRVKIEAAPENLDIPQTDAEAQRLPLSNYFEYHLKLIFPAATRDDEIRPLCEAHGAHLSANAFKHRDDGRSERFVTLRCFQAGRQTSDERLEMLRHALSDAGQELSKSICEYCVYDSNVALDAGWLEP